MVLRTTLGGRPPPRVPLVWASCRQQAKTMPKGRRRARERQAGHIDPLEHTNEPVLHQPTFRAMHAHFGLQKEDVARDAGHLPTAAWQVWPRERTRCKGQAPEWCCERWLPADSGVAGWAAGAYPLQGAGSRTVLRTTLGGRPPPRVPFVSASCREQAQTMLKKLPEAPGANSQPNRAPGSQKRSSF